MDAANWPRRREFPVRNPYGDALTIDTLTKLRAVEREPMLKMMEALGENRSEVIPSGH